MPKKMRSYFFAFMLCVLCLAMPVMAAEIDNEIMPANLYVTDLYVGGEIDMVTGELSATTQIITHEKCSFYIVIDIYQFKDNEWKNIKSFRRPTSGTYVGMLKSYTITYDVDTDYDYKVKATAYVTSVADGISETIEVTSPILPYK